MWVEPNGNVRILTGVPINKDYENTLYFATRSAQETYFISKTKVIPATLTAPSRTLLFPKVTYQRLERNYMKLEINAELLYDCNYLMYQNTAFGNKWFYAFITGVDYVANQVTRISYEIDVIQTWLLDCTINPSFVVRKHFSQDSRYASRIPEGLDTGEYQVSELTMTPSVDSTFGNTIYVMAVTRLPWGSGTAQDQAYNSFKRVRGAGSGLYYLCFPITDSVYDNGVLVPNAGILGVNAVIDNYRAWDSLGVSVEDIVMIFEAPKTCFLSENEPVVTVSSALGGISSLFRTDGYMYNPLNVNPNTDMQTVNTSYVLPTSVGSYTPRNKKLLQYPYNFVYVYDSKGSNAVYNSEDFNLVWDSQSQTYVAPTTGTLQIQYAGNADTAMRLVPLNYKGVAKNHNEAMVFKGFPQCSWNNDLFKAWFAQNGGVVGSVVRGFSGIDTEGLSENISKFGKVESVAGSRPYTMPVGEDGKRHRLYGEPSYSDVRNTDLLTKNLSDVGSSIMGELGNLYKHSKMPSQACGNFNTDLAYYDGVHSFKFLNMHIREDYARRLDYFFDMYGYACNNVEAVDYSSRPHWNYIKTAGLNIEASIPEDDAEAIIRIFSNGIRFWKYPAEVGHYTTVDNRPS